MFTQGSNVETEIVEQYYNVMPILGKELAKLVKTYAGYESPKPNDKARIPSPEEAAEQQRLNLPETVLPQDLADKSGYLIEQTEREYILSLFRDNPNLQRIAEGTSFPEGHPLQGKKTSNEVFRDNHGNIYVIHNKELLGAGSFGKVAVAQAIHVSDPAGLVKEKGFYACKVQTIKSNNKVEDIQAEMNKNALFDLHLGQMHIEETRPKAAKSTTQPQAQAAESTPVKTVAQTGTIVAREEEMPVKTITQTGSIVTHDNASTTSMETGSIVTHDNPTPPQTGSIVVAHDDKPVTAAAETGKGVGHEENSKKVEKEKFVPEFSKMKFNNEFDIEGPNSKKPPKTIKEMAESSKTIKEITAKNDLNEFDVEKYLELFELMTAEVEKAHAKGILHLDIKAENFLYDPKTNSLRLIDYGLSKSLHDPNLPTPQKFCQGSPTNIAPECYHKDFTEKLSTKQDIYGLNRTFGLLMVGEMLKFTSEAYKDRLPTHEDNIKLAADKKILTTPYLENVTFSNQFKHPHTQAINEMMQLMHKMNSYDVASRPEATEVRATLSAIKKNYQKRMEEREQFKEALKGVDFKGPQIGQAFQARQAIEKYNQKMLEAWQAKPVGERGVKPLPLRIPDIDELKGILIEREQEKKALADAKKEGARVTSGEGSAIPPPAALPESAIIAASVSPSHEQEITTLERQTPEAQASEAQAPEAQAPEAQAPEAQVPEVQALMPSVAAPEPITEIPKASDFTETELLAITEYILQKMNNSSGPTFLDAGSSIDVPEEHILHGKKLPFKAVKDSLGVIAVGDPSQTLGKGSYGSVIKGIVLYSPDPKLKVETECALKTQAFQENTANETQILKCIIMPLIPGKEMAKVIRSYDGYKSSNADILNILSTQTDTDTLSERNSELRESDTSDLSSKSPPSPAVPASSGTVMYPTPEPAAPASSGTVMYPTPEPAAPASSGTVMYPTPEPAASASSGTVMYPTPEPAAPVASGTVMHPTPEPAASSESAADTTSEQAVAPSGTVEQTGYNMPFDVVQLSPNASQNSFDVSNWLDLFGKIATELDERAHQHGVAHLDLKPENLILSEKEVDGKKKYERVTLIDFGVSEVIDPKNIPPKSKGTTVFMAPEMFDLRNKQAHTTKQDMYSLGRVYESLMFQEMKGYYPDAYTQKTYDDSVVRAMYIDGVSAIKMTYGNYLDRFYFDNPNNDPHLEATNELLKIIYELKTPDRNMRPEAKQVAERIAQIQNRLAERLAAQEALKTEAPLSSVAETPHITVFEPDTPVAAIGKQVEPESMQPLTPEAQSLEAQTPEAQAPETPHISVFEPDTPVAAIGKQVEPEALQPLSEPDTPVAMPEIQIEPQQLDPLPLSEPDAIKAARVAAAEPVPMDPIKAPEPDAAKVAQAKKSDPEPMKAVLEPIEVKNSQVEKALAQEKVAKPPLQRMDGRRNIQIPELPKPKAGVMEGLDSFINKWSKVKAVQEHEKRAKSVVTESKTPEVKAPEVKADSKQNVLASPVERAKAAAERQYNDPNRVEINISGGLLFGKAVADRQRKDREKELAELRSQRAVSEAPKSKKPTA